jgi:hypothetical protein
MKDPIQQVAYTLVDEVSQTMYVKQPAAKELLEHGTPIIFNSEIWDGDARRHFRVQITEVTASSAAPTGFMPAPTYVAPVSPKATASYPVASPFIPYSRASQNYQPTGNRSGKNKGSKRRFLIPALLALLLLLVLLIPVSFAFGWPTFFRTTTTQQIQKHQPVMTPLCKLSDAKLSELFQAPVVKHMSEYGDCMLAITGNFSIPADQTLTAQLVTPPSSRLLLTQRGVGAEFPDRVEILEITIASAGWHYGDIEFPNMVSVRTSLLIINPVVTIDSVKSNCGYWLSLYDTEFLATQEKQPTGCFSYSDDHPSH